jgi:Sulfate permease and related transporters (MFS superfamily)
MTAQSFKQWTRQKAPYLMSQSSMIPRDGLEGLKDSWRADVISGFVVFMIALPLSLGIAMTSGAPPIAGLISAIIGGIIVSLAGGSHLSINGPAAGLAIVIICSVERLGGGLADTKPPWLPSSSRVRFWSYSDSCVLESWGNCFQPPWFTACSPPSA